jgi:hypothetical protein
VLAWQGSSDLSTDGGSPAACTARVGLTVSEEKLRHGSRLRDNPVKDQVLLPTLHCYQASVSTALHCNRERADARDDQVRYGNAASILEVAWASAAAHDRTHAVRYRHTWYIYIV